MGIVKELFSWSQAVMSMLLVQIFATGMQILSRIILVEGTFIFALIAYRHVVAAVCVAPFAFYFERGITKKLGWSIWFWLFLNALVGITLAMGLFYYGLRDTSATYSVNFLNLVPIFTFTISVICRMERLCLQRWSSKVKTVGAILCVGGALTTSIYKGKEFHVVQSNHHTHSTIEASKTNMLRGTLFLVGSCLSYTAWFIVQVKLLKVFPLKYWGTMLTCIIASIQATIVGICLDCRKVTWSLKWNLQLITIIYSGALATAATFCLIYRVIAIKGPTYPAMFNPLALIFVAISEAILLGEPIRLGILLGMVLILIGLYSFLWGKRKETQCLPQPNIEAGQVSTSMVVAESAGVHATALVVPSSSPNVEKTDRN
ncbi:WAT1-related protein At5g07050-like [Gastrolobium bilobum]|uniref:WAT1-related protein At5g07050-like n=1 Tax=Gastrolobium bilobum TaxID=150636 RepID=UPI002AB31895|nr:WAT1-related protein At5g07050-like [Gastrolobium bilobum]